LARDPAAVRVGLPTGPLLFAMSSKMLSILAAASACTEGSTRLYVSRVSVTLA